MAILITRPDHSQGPVHQYLQRVDGEWAILGNTFKPLPPDYVKRLVGERRGFYTTVARLEEASIEHFREFRDKYSLLVEQHSEKENERARLAHRDLVMKASAIQDAAATDITPGDLYQNLLSAIASDDRPTAVSLYDFNVENDAHDLTPSQGIELALRKIGRKDDSRPRKIVAQKTDEAGLAALLVLVGEPAEWFEVELLDRSSGRWRLALSSGLGVSRIVAKSLDAWARREAEDLSPQPLRPLSFRD